MTTTNYSETFIAIAEDCQATHGTAPAESAKPTVAFLTFRLIHDHPYEFTSDDVLFEVYATRQGIPAAKRAAARREFFSRPQACLRSSDLGKRYGWGIHSDARGRVALYGVESAQYAAFVSGEKAVVKRALRSSR